MSQPTTTLSRLYRQALARLAGEHDDLDPTDHRVFDAVLTVLDGKGVREATMDEFAAVSHVSRATLFRRYGSKDHLLELVLARDMRRLLADIAHPDAGDPADHLARTFVTCMTWSRHPLLTGGDGYALTEFIAALSANEPSILRSVTHFIADSIRIYQRDGQLPTADADLQADLLVHLVIGCITAPTRTLDLDDPDALYDTAITLVAPILLHPRPHTH